MTALLLPPLRHRHYYYRSVQRKWRCHLQQRQLVVAVPLYEYHHHPPWG
jgi:hypothetical protein